jgi:hypothetical protein
MNDQTHREHLEAVLDDFVAAGAPSSQALAEWTRRYPQFERELTRFAASWQLSGSLPISPDAAHVPDEVLVQRGLGAVQDLLAAASARAQAEPPIQGLLHEARRLGLRPRQFAAATGLGESLLAKLDRGLIRFASIPSQALEALAFTLQRDLGSIRDYLAQRNPSVAAAAAFKAEQAPQAGEPEDFFAAVTADSTMTAEQRARWLDLAPPDHR